MWAVTIKLDQAHLRALRTLLDRLGVENIERYAHSDQESYDMIFALECVRAAVNGATTLPVMHQHDEQQHDREQPHAKRRGD
jgi:hypothetical protein